MPADTFSAGDDGFAEPAAQAVTVVADGGAARGDAQGDRGDAGRRQPADAVHREVDPAARAERQVAVDAGVVEPDRVDRDEAGAPGQGARPRRPAVRCARPGR